MSKLDDEESRYYLKCTFDCYVTLTDETMKKRFDGDLVLISEIVGRILANSLSGLEEISHNELSLTEGEITTKYILAKQGVKRFEIRRTEQKGEDEQ